MLTEIADVSAALAREHDDFWIAAGLTDWSYEEGERNDKWKAAIRLYVEAGCSGELERKLRLGINKLLACALAELPGFVIDQPHRERGKLPDVVVRRGDESARLEVKLVFDCTYASYYPSVANDWLKLQAYRAEGFTGRLFQLVYFVQFPHYCYGGRTRRETATVGIGEQYREVARLIPAPVTWPADPPYVHKMKLPSDSVVQEVIERRFARTWPSPAKGLEFSTAVRDAAVGLAIWELAS